MIFGHSIYLLLLIVQFHNELKILIEFAILIDNVTFFRLRSRPKNFGSSDPRGVNRARNTLAGRRQRRLSAPGSLQRQRGVDGISDDDDDNNNFYFHSNLKWWKYLLNELAHSSSNVMVNEYQKYSWLSIFSIHIFLLQVSPTRNRLFKWSRRRPTTQCTWPCQTGGCPLGPLPCPAFTAWPRWPQPAQLWRLIRRPWTAAAELSCPAPAEALTWRRAVETIIRCQTYRKSPTYRLARQCLDISNTNSKSSNNRFTVFRRLSTKTRSAPRTLERRLRVQQHLSSNSNSLPSRVSPIGTGFRATTRPRRAARRALPVPPLLPRRNRKGPPRALLRPITGSGRSTPRGSSVQLPSPCRRFMPPSNLTVSASTKERTHLFLFLLTQQIWSFNSRFSNTKFFVFL